MILDHTKATRYGIYVFHDRDGIVDGYVDYLLDDLTKNLSGLTIVCNGKLGHEGRRTFLKYTTNIVCRPDVGFDIAGWKESILNFVGLEKLGTYDEVVLFNDSFYGPFYPLDRVFREMATRDVDFWGITNHNEAPDNELGSVFGYIPEFLQSFFTVFRRSIVASPEFKAYWEEIPDTFDFVSGVHLHEVVYAEKFKNMGFTWEPYIDTSDYNVEGRRNICINSFMPDRIISERGLPLLRRKIFVLPFAECLHHSAGGSLAKSMKYIRDNTGYDTDLIWKNLLRLYSISDLKQSMHLNYVVSDEVLQTPSAGASKAAKPRAAVVLHLFYEDLFDHMMKYVRAVPDDVALYVTTSTPAKKSKLESLICSIREGLTEVRCVGTRGRDLGALLVGCSDVLKQYDFVCFTHDKKTFGGTGAFPIGQSFLDLIADNVLASKIYVRNILSLFDEHPRLGIVGPPRPIHHCYFASIGDEWTSCFDVTNELAIDLKLKCRLDRDKRPFLLGSSFWLRTKAFGPLLEKELEYEDFPEEPVPNDGTISHALERIFPFVAQSEGYYSAWVMTPDYAALEISNLNFMLSGILRIQQEKYAPHRAYSYHEFTKRLEKDAILLVDSNDNSIIPGFYSARAYIDFGDGFSENTCVIARYSLGEDGYFRIRFGINTKRMVKRVRFDPLEGRMCLCKLESQRCNGEEVVFDWDNSALVMSNGFKMFKTGDPSFVLTKSFVDGIETLEVSGYLSVVNGHAGLDGVGSSCAYVGRLYYDSGTGWSESHCIPRAYAVNAEGNFTFLARDLDLDKVVGLRFDPAEGRPCLCKIQSCECNGVPFVFHHDNSACVNNGYRVFRTTDPFFLSQGISISRVREVRISGLVTFLPDGFDMDAFQESLEQRVGRNGFRHPTLRWITSGFWVAKVRHGSKRLLRTAR